MLSNFITFFLLINFLCSTVLLDRFNLNDNFDNCDREKCKLPLCKCSDTEVPGNMNLADVPMMVALTFNGVLQNSHVRNLKKILNPIYKNPTGCPIQATFFVSDETNGRVKTDYCLVQKLFNNNNEISVSAPKYTCPYTDCNSKGWHFGGWGEETSDKEIFLQKKNLAKKAKINRSFLRGFRVPLLDNAGSIHFRALKKYAFSYDSSVTINPMDIKNFDGLRVWPHTIDYRANYTCTNCPTRSTFCEINDKNCTLLPFWIVPLHYFDAEGSNPCPSLIAIETDSDRLKNRKCLNNTELTQSILEDLLYNNFRRHYETNKAPYVINIETSWFNTHSEILTNALVNFISNLTSENEYSSNNYDVYFVSVEKIIEWSERPVPTHVIANKWLWDCDVIDIDYDQPCDFADQIIKNAEELEEIRNGNKSKLILELKGEDLFRNGVLTAVIVAFILCSLFVVLYDKFY